MKAKSFLATFCLGLSILLCVLFVSILVHQQVQATIATGQPVLGYTELSLSGGTTGTSSTLNLASSASTAGTSTIPCYNMTLIPSMTYTGSGTASLYMGSGTTATCLLMSGGSNQYAGKTGGLLIASSGTAATLNYVQDGTVQKSIALPMVTNVNQLWFKLTNSDSGASTATCNVEAIYTK